MTTQTDVRDLISQHATGSLPGGFTVAYPDKPFTVPEANTEWARITIRRVGRSQKGYGDGIRKFVGYGVLCIQIFTKQGEGLVRSDLLSESSVRYLESMVSSPIVYRNIRAVDIGPDGAFTQTNIYADFEYEDHH